MSVITTLITKHGTAHATDSLITMLNADGRREPVTWDDTKIIPVRAWRGAMSYYGIASIKDKWFTLDWLRLQAERANESSSPEHFAEIVATGLNADLLPVLDQFRIGDPARGIGIHFSAYERFEDRWIPELFHINNWADQNGGITRRDVVYSRETFATVSDCHTQPEHREPEYRLAVATALQDHVQLLRYNNGDPKLYNAAADAILGMFMVLAERGHLKNPGDMKTLRALARRPVEIVTEIQQDFCKEGTRIVGGRVHDLMIMPTGEYFSTSGDGIETEFRPPTNLKTRRKQTLNRERFE